MARRRNALALVVVKVRRVRLRVVEPRVLRLVTRFALASRVEAFVS
jgi:hypothetical protein